MAKNGPGQGRFSLDQLRITRGAVTLAGLEIGLSLVWFMSGPDVRATMGSWLVASPSSIFHHGRVWTLLTSPFLELNALGLVLHMIVLWSFVPRLERFWGMQRFVGFVAITSVVGGLAGTLVGLATGRDVPIYGLDAFIYAAIVAFGVVYAKDHIQFFGRLPLTGRQLMFGFIGFAALFVVLQQFWEVGASFAAAMVTAAVLTARRNPAVRWKQWRRARRLAKLTLIPGGKKPDDKTWIN